jgi:hypothetical protein
MRRKRKWGHEPTLRPFPKHRQSSRSSRPRKPVANLSTLAKRMRESGVQPDEHWQEAVEKRMDALLEKILEKEKGQLRLPL